MEEWATILELSHFGLHYEVYWLARSIQFHKHEPSVNSSSKKALQILMWIRQTNVFRSYGCSAIGRS